MKKKNLAALKYFALGLSISVFVLSLIAVWVVFTATPLKPYISSSSSFTNEVFVPTQKDSINFLIALGEKSDGIAKTYMLIRINPLSGQIPVCVFNENTAAKTIEKNDTLGGFYAKGGIVMAKQALEYTFDIKIDRYAKTTYEDYKTVLNTLGAVEFTVPYSLNYEGSDKIVKITSGKQLLNGAKIVDIMQYPKYKGGELERMNMNAEVTAAAINQFLSIWLSSKIDDIFSMVINLV
ncbi:MAG TPA: hypothetical protein DCP97_05445, partial [Ruminococcaceae bacterium]|nr:hypothetical protein [Oscillospiraceae bacterium]